MSAIDKVVGHYKELCQSPKKIDVPEWDMTIYAKPMSMNEEEEIDIEAEGSNFKRAVEIIFRKALDENGTRHFTTKDERIRLRKFADSKVVTRVALAMAGESATPIDDATEEMEGN